MIHHPNTIALDLGTTTGWAAYWEGVLTSGTESFKNDRFSGGGMRYLRFSKWLAEAYQNIQPQAIYYEEVRRHMSTDAAHVYGGFMSHLTAFCEAKKVPYQSIPVGTIKKHATGKGNAPKSEMIDAAMKAWPEQSIKDDNQADALWILSCALGGIKEGTKNL